MEKEEISEELSSHDKQTLLQQAEEFREKMHNRGVVYMSRVPPGITVKKIREFFERYRVERVFLKPEKRKHAGGNFQRRYTEGWIEFEDKNLAKFVAITFDGQRIGEKKKDIHYDDFWSLRYLPKFKWENLIEIGVSAHQERKKKLNQKVQQAKREHDDYLGRSEKSKKVKQILQGKAKKILEEEGGDPNDREEVKATIVKRLLTKKR